MKILYHHRTASKDGQAVHIEEMIEALRALGHEVRVVAPMAEAATETRYGKLPEPLRYRIRAMSAATDNVGLFFGEDIFVATGHGHLGLTQSAGTGTTTLNGISGSGISGNLSLTTSHVQFATAPITVGGTVTIAATAVNLASGTGLTVGGNIAITAGSGSFTQSGTAPITTTSRSFSDQPDAGAPGSPRLFTAIRS